MDDQLSAKQIEQKVFAATFEDGLWDVFLGCFVLMFAVAPLLSGRLGDFWSSAVFLPFWALARLGIRLVRKHVVTPRVGIVQFGRWRKARLRRFTLVASLTCLVALLLGVLSAYDFGIVPGWVHVARFSLAILLGFSTAAYLLNFTRLYLYGMLIALSPLIGEWLYTSMSVPHHGFPVTFGVTAGITILTGLVVFGRFLREHPLPPEQRVPRAALE